MLHQTPQKIPEWHDVDEKNFREDRVDELLAKTEDAYTVPPFYSFAPEISVDGLDHDELRRRERAILSSAIEHAWRIRLRVTGHGWSDAIPSLVAHHNTAVALVAEPLPERVPVADPVG